MAFSHARICIADNAIFPVNKTIPSYRIFSHLHLLRLTDTAYVYKEQSLSASLIYPRD